MFTADDREISMITAAGWLGATLILLAYAQTNLRRLRQISVLGGIALLMFNFAVHMWPNVVLELVLGVINVRRLLELRARPTVEQCSHGPVNGVDPTPDDAPHPSSPAVTWPALQPRR